MIAALISALTLGQSLLAGHLLASRVTHSNVYWPMALFFFVNALAQLCFIVREPLVIGTELEFLPELTLFKLWLELSCRLSHGYIFESLRQVMLEGGACLTSGISLYRFSLVCC